MLARWAARIKSKGRTREGKGRKEKKKRTARKGIKKRLGRVLVCVRVLHLIYNRLKQIILIKKQKIICFYLVVSKYVCIFAHENKNELITQ